MSLLVLVLTCDSMALLLDGMYCCVLEVFDLTCHCKSRVFD